MRTSNIKISWKETEILVFNIARQLTLNDFKPNVIVPIIRGGMVPARLICSYFDKAIVCPITAKLYLSDIGSVDVGEFNCCGFYGQLKLLIKLLIVDDISDGGETLEAVKNKIIDTFLFDKSTPLRNLFKTATLIYREGSNFIPDFHGKKVNHKKWFVFPWEKKLK